VPVTVNVIASKTGALQIGLENKIAFYLKMAVLLLTKFHWFMETVALKLHRRYHQ
jgi:hypothetical protein